MTNIDPRELQAKAKSLLNQRWRAVLQLDSSENPCGELHQKVRALLCAQTKSFAYALFTQTLARAVAPELDPRCVQKGSGLGSGSFDARSLAVKVVVPWERENGAVLGGSSDPYVSKPLRVSEFVKSHRSQYKYPDEFDSLCEVLDAASKMDPVASVQLFDQVLVEYRRLLEARRVDYPAPQRASLQDAIDSVMKFLEEKSGGVRLQACLWAAVKVVNKRCEQFDEILCNVVNAPDGSRRVADVDCRKHGCTLKGYEAKEMTLTGALLGDKVRACRERGVKEIVFVVHAERIMEDDVRETVEHEYRSGLNIYVVSARVFFECHLREVGEAGRADFVREVGNCLEEMRARYADRRAWADMAAEM